MQFVPADQQRFVDQRGDARSSREMDRGDARPSRGNVPIRARWADMEDDGGDNPDVGCLGPWGKACAILATERAEDD